MTCEPQALEQYVTEARNIRRISDRDVNVKPFTGRWSLADAMYASRHGATREPRSSIEAGNDVAYQRDQFPDRQRAAAVLAGVVVNHDDAGTATKREEILRPRDVTGQRVLGSRNRHRIPERLVMRTDAECYVRLSVVDELHELREVVGHTRDGAARHLRRSALDDVGVLGREGLRERAAR